MMHRAVIFFALLVANISLWLIPVPHGLTVSFLDVGEGDAVFIQGPTGARVLVDAGPAAGPALRGIGERLPFFVRSLDAVIETTPTASYSAGLVGVFERYSSGMFLSSPVAGDTKTADVVSRAAADSGTKHVVLSRGMRVMLGGGAFIDVLSPDASAQKLNANSGALVLRVVFGKTSFLLSSGALQKTEIALVQKDGTSLQSDMLKAGGHGSKTASAPAFAVATSPRYVVFSRGCGNTYGHPATTTAELFRSLGASIYDTCEDGTITLGSDGVALSFE